MVVIKCVWEMYDRPYPMIPLRYTCIGKTDPLCIPIACTDATSKRCSKLNGFKKSQAGQRGMSDMSKRSGERIQYRQRRAVFRMSVESSLVSSTASKSLTSSSHGRDMHSD